MTQSNKFMGQRPQGFPTGDRRPIPVIPPTQQEIDDISRELVEAAQRAEKCRPTIESGRYWRAALMIARLERAWLERTTQ